MKKIYVPIFWRFTLSLIIIVTIFGVTNIFFVKTNINSTLLKESEKRVKYIAMNLARQSVDPILYGDYITLQLLVNEISMIDPSVAYAFVISKTGSIIIHDFDDGIPTNLIKLNSIKRGQNYNIVMVQSKNANEGLIRDIAVPILGGEVGTVRIGIYNTDIVYESRRIVNMLLLMIGIFLIIGILGAFLLSLIITYPIKTISNFAEKLDLESLKDSEYKYKEPEIRSWSLFPKLFQTTDELNDLAERFNNMVNRLIVAYKELEKTYTKLVETEKLASIGMLAASVAHEINNPIAGLQSSIRMIQKNPDNYKRNEKYILMMSDATIKIEKVVRSMLDYSRHEASIDEVINIDIIIEKALFLVEYNTQKHNIIVNINGLYDCPLIRGSKNELEQVFVNIFMNSIDAIVLKSELRPNSTKDINIDLSSTTNEIIIAISDTGIGMSNNELKKVFEPFFTTKEVGKGTGLGLYVCRKIIKAHNGDISVESDINIGTKILIKLPTDK